MTILSFFVFHHILPVKFTFFEKADWRCL